MNNKILKTHLQKCKNAAIVILSVAKNLTILRSLNSLRRTSWIVLLYLIFNFSVAQAGVCIWRFPDKDIKTLFPKATGYRTEVLTYSKEEKIKIESILGAKLDDDENKFNFYRIYKDTIKIGLVMTHSVKGQYGAIEVVIGMQNKFDSTGKYLGASIINTLIQRDREVKSKDLRSDKFLNQFMGKTVKSRFDNIIPVPGAEKSSQAIGFSVRKLLIVQSILDKEKIK